MRKGTLIRAPQTLEGEREKEMCKNPLAPLIVSWARSAEPAGLASFAGLELDENPRVLATSKDQRRRRGG